MNLKVRQIKNILISYMVYLIKTVKNKIKKNNKLFLIYQKNIVSLLCPKKNKLIQDKWMKIRLVSTKTLKNNLLK